MKSRKQILEKFKSISDLIQCESKKLDMNNNDPVKSHEWFDLMSEKLDLLMWVLEDTNDNK